MAIKVLSRPADVFPMKLTCGHCKAELEVESIRDITHWEDGPNYNTCTVYGVKCPVCGQEVPAKNQGDVRREWEIARKR